MRGNRHLFKTIISLILCLCMALGLAACGGSSKEGQLHVDVLSTLDAASFTVDGEGIASFTSYTPDGRPLRFSGVGISLDEEGRLVMLPDAKLFSLDYMGQLTDFFISAEDSDLLQDISYGPCFANSPNPVSIKALRTGFIAARSLEGKTQPDVREFESGFFALRAWDANPEALVITSLVLSFDETVPQVFTADLDPNSVVAGILVDYGINWNNSSSIQVVGNSVEHYALSLLENPEVLRWEIISSIDPGSIRTEGDSTFFTAYAPGGVPIRFEGNNISIDENGILLNPDSNVTALDALGKIIAYYPSIHNREQIGENDPNNPSLFTVNYGYTYSAAITSVDRAKQVHTYGASYESAELLDGTRILPVAVFQPNFVSFSGSGTYSTKSFTLAALEVCYDPTEKVTLMTEAMLDPDFSGSYLEGGLYDYGKEQSADLDSSQLSFYLILKPDTELAYLTDTAHAVCFVPKEFYTVGDLHRADGSVMDKKNDRLEPGCWLDLYVGDSYMQLPLRVLERYKGAQTQDELVPYGTAAAEGEVKPIVLPLLWPDQPEQATEQTLQLFRERLGRVMDESGNVSDHSSADTYSLSSYFDLSSYGKLSITSFLTDWYTMPDTFEAMSLSAPDEAFADEVAAWLKSRYPGMDWSQFDADCDGVFDLVVFLSSGVNSSDMYYPMSFDGGVQTDFSYIGDRAGTQVDPGINTVLALGRGRVTDGAGTLVHETSHAFGLIDYYDVGYSGINAVGGYDMESDSVGDWNAFSKLSVGWMEPQVVSGLAPGESVELSIRSSALYGDMIVIPAAGSEYDGPFGEYVTLELLTDDGVNIYDAADYGLTGVEGIRLSHVNAAMEKRSFDDVESLVLPGQSASYVIGTPHLGNNYTGSEMGRYHIEVIQSGGVNSLTNVERAQQYGAKLSAEDLFYAGDKFDAADYAEFFYQGLLDDGSEFGYVVEIVSIGTDSEGIPCATVRVTAK